MLLGLAEGDAIGQYLPALRALEDSKLDIKHRSGPVKSP